MWHLQLCCLGDCAPWCVAAGWQWALHITETPLAFVLSGAYIFGTVISGWPIFTAIRKACGSPGTPHRRQEPLERFSAASWGAKGSLHRRSCMQGLHELRPSLRPATALAEGQPRGVWQAQSVVLRPQAQSCAAVSHACGPRPLCGGLHCADAGLGGVPLPAAVHGPAAPAPPGQRPAGAHRQAHPGTPPSLPWPLVQ